MNNMFVGILRRRFEHLENITGSCALDKYYNIKNTETTKTNIEYFINLDKSIVELHIRFFKKDPAYNFKQLPLEICGIISSYNVNYINIKFEILFPISYPLNEIPIWSFVDVQHNIKSILNLKNYYEYIVDTHNNRNKHDWSAAIQIDRDILEFFEKINYFDYILDYN